MGLFGKSEAQKQEKRIQASLATLMKKGKISDMEQPSPEYRSAIVALRSEGPAAEEFMLSVANAGPPFPHNLILWQAICDMGESVVPCIAHVMNTSRSDSARAQAVMALGAFAQIASPEVRQACLREVRDAATRDDDGVLHTAAKTMMEILADKGIV
jgi:hypothetical protein